MSALNKKLKETVMAKTTAAPHVVAVEHQNDWLFYPAASAPAAEKRFSQFISTVISKAGFGMDPVDRLICCAIAFEAIPSIQSLLGFLHGLTSIARRSEHLHITWFEADQLQRRSVSAFTAIAAKAVNLKAIDWDEQITNMAKVLDPIYPVVKGVSSAKLLSHVLADSVAWMYLHIPPVCFSYLTGYLPLALLPESVHARSIGIRPSTKSSVTMVETSIEHVFAHTKEIALEVAYSDRTNAYKSRDILHAMKSLVAKHRGCDSIRSADFKDKDNFRSKLGSIGSALMRAGCPVDALLLSWEIYLIESGTIRLRNPKISTVRRYVSSGAEIIFHALHRAKTAPADMSDENWRVFFTELAKDNEGDSEFRCALASFHLFLVDEFGIDPIPSLFFGVAENSLPAANALWPHEIAAAKSLIDQDVLDPRLAAMLRVMLAIGAGNKVRIGEVCGLRLRNIREYEENGSLEIQIAPRRGDHEGKTSAAKRTLDYTDSEDRQEIVDWLDKRRNEGAIEHDLFFGDPHDTAKGYLLGACQRLLNKILKTATGDSSVSFHSLRHTGVNRDLCNALLTTEHSSISPIQRISIETGHQNDRTTFRDYFHCPELVIRFWIDRASTKRLTAQTLALWIGKSPVALRQALHRSTNKDGLFPKLAKHHALSLYEQLQPSPPLEPNSIKSQTENATGLSFHLLSKMISDIAKDHPLAAVMSLNTVDEDQVVKVCRAVADVSSSLEARHRQRRSLLLPNANNQSCFEYARDSIKRHKTHFSLAGEPHLDSLFEMLAPKVRLFKELIAAAASWIFCKENDYISLEEVNEALPLIKLIHAANIPVANLIIRIQIANLGDASCVAEALNSAYVVAARSAFEQVFAAKAHLEGVCAKPDGTVRSDRPKQYLLISRRRLGNGKTGSSAGCRMTRFHSLMFTLAVMASLGKAA